MSNGTPRRAATPSFMSTRTTASAPGNPDTKSRNMGASGMNAPSGAAQGPAKAVAAGTPIPYLDFLFAVFACCASSVVWLWFTSPKPNYFWNLVLPVLVLLFCGVVAPLLVFLAGGLAGLFKLEVPGLTRPPRTHRHVHSRRRKYYVFAALFTTAAMISIVFHVPLYARFALSRAAMDTFLTDVQWNPEAALPATMRVGSFVLETRPQQRRDGALMFHLAGDSKAGFTYSATPIRYPGGNRGDGHSLGGGWYWFSDE